MKKKTENFVFISRGASSKQKIDFRLDLVSVIIPLSHIYRPSIHQFASLSLSNLHDWQRTDIVTRAHPHQTGNKACVCVCGLRHHDIVISVNLLVVRHCQSAIM